VNNVKEKQMNEIYVLIYQPHTTIYQFYHTEEEAHKTLEAYKKNQPNLYAVVEKWDMVKFANWIANELSIIGQSGFHIG
jgi:hypothetical protein